MSSKFLSNSLSIFPSFLKGSARLADPMGNLDAITALTPETDRKALNQDWLAIGQDLNFAIKSYEASTGQTKKE